MNLYIEVLSTYRSSLKQLKYCFAHALHKIKQLVCSFDANKALGFALCFISILAIRMCHTLFLIRALATML